MCESFAIVFFVTDGARLPNTNLLDAVLRCWGPPGRFKESFIVFGRILDTVWRKHANMWPEKLNLQDKYVLCPLPAPCDCPLTSPLMIKLCLFTFKSRILQWFKLTLPLACALDLAALENIPSLSFRNVYRYQPEVMKVFSVLILIPRCLRCIPCLSQSCNLKGKTDPQSVLNVTEVCPSSIQIKSDLYTLHTHSSVYIPKSASPFLSNGNICDLWCVCRKIPLPFLLACFFFCLF